MSKKFIQNLDPNKYQDLIDAATNNNITVDLYEKYPELHNKSIEDYVHFTCSICSKETSLRWLNIHRRTNKDWICSSCVAHRTLRQKQNLPEELWYSGTEDNPYTWEQYVKYHDQFLKGSSKLWVQGTCTICNDNFILATGNLLRRHYTSLDEICPNCINKYKSNLPEVLQKNSNVQKIAQNRSEVKEKQRIAQAKALANDPDLIYKKVTCKNRLCGYINNIFFASSTELEYILLNSHVQNCKLQIKYMFNGVEHTYYPDFQYIDNNGKIVIVEIKGKHWLKDKMQAKIQGANNFIKLHNEYSRYEFVEHNIIEQKCRLQGISRILTINHLINVKKQYPSLKIKSIPETLLKSSQFKTKQEAIDYINNLK